MSLVAGTIRLLTGAQARWQGEMPFPEGPSIYFANHGSHLDSIVIWAALPETQRARTRPVAARDYWEKGLRGRLARKLRAVLIDRARSDPDADPLAPLAEALEQGDSLIIFPEGTRSTDGQVHEFRAGLYHLAKRFPEVACMPVLLENLNRILPKGELLPVPLLGAIRFGAPLQLEPDEDKAAFLTRARQAVLDLGEPCPSA